MSRFAACPFCSLRLDRVARAYAELHDRGVEVLVVFPSSLERLRRYADKYKPPFRVVADPDERILSLYQVENSWKGELRSIVNPGKVVRALRAAKQNPLAVDSAVHQMPADFLIDRNVIEQVRYGERLDDGFDPSHVLRWANSARSAASDNTVQ